MKLGWPYPKRKQHIEKLTNTTSKETFGVRFQGKYTYYPVYSVSVEFPKYRLENGRTCAAQEEYISSTKGVPEDFFTKDTESDEAQKIQHKILKEMANEEGLHAYFKKNEQEEPLLLTSEGIVINGNRRLCSMREHYETDRKTFARYRNVRVIVLPPADDKELDWLEGKEQIQEDIKAEYRWTATAIMYRRRMDHHKLTVNDLAAIYEQKSGEIQELLDMFDHAKIFLQEQGKPGMYHTVDRSDYAFRQLRKYRAKIKDVAKREVFDKLCYTVIEKPLGDRAYQTVSDISKHFDKILLTLKKEKAPAAQKTPKKAKPKKPTKSPSSLLGKPKAAQTDLLNTVSDKKNQSKVRSVLKDVIDGEKRAAQEKKDSTYASSQVRNAVNALQRVADDVKNKSSKSSKQGVGQQLDEVTKLVKQLRNWVNAKSKN